MLKAGQVKNLGRGAYVHPDYQENPDNADDLTNGRSNVRNVRALSWKGRDAGRPRV